MKLAFAFSTFAALAAPVAASVPSLGCATVDACDPKTINFEEFSRGAYIPMNAYAGCGIAELTCKAKTDAIDATPYECRVFDTEVAYGSWDVPGSDTRCSTSSCSISGGCIQGRKDLCGDSDLIAPFVNREDPGGALLSPGKVLIFDEVSDINGFGDSHGSQNYPPDDSGAGARMYIHFESPVTVNSMEFLDIEEVNTYVQFHFSDGSDDERFYIDSTGDAAMRAVTYDVDNVDYILIEFAGSGAISAVTYTDTDECFGGGNSSGGGGGDPHIQRWDRERFSFHGECDLVMTSSEMFHDGAGLDLHIRTTIQDFYSYIEMAALRVGSTILEVQKGAFYMGEQEFSYEQDLPLTFAEGDYTYTFYEIPAAKNGDSHRWFKLDLGDKSSIVFKFYKHFLTIAVDGNAMDFGDSVGLLGDFAHGDMLDRSGNLMEEAMDFGFEWQVSPNERTLFHELRAPQLPYEKCRLPTMARTEKKRRLRANKALAEQAHQACAHLKSDFALCVHDVTATGDLGMADLW